MSRRGLDPGGTEMSHVNAGDVASALPPGSRSKRPRLVWWLGLSLLAASWALVGFTAAPAGAAGKSDAAKVERGEGGGAARVKVSAKAAERLGIQTTPIREQDAPKKGESPRKVIPYSAVLYDLNGKTWVYASPEALVFVRHPIAVDHIR